MKELILSLVSFVLVAGTATAQTRLPSRTLEIIPRAHRQIADINAMRLRPCYIGGMPGQEWSELRTSIYFDDEGCIRKSISQYSYPEGDGGYICYFDTAGVAIYSMSRCNSGHDGDISICLYRDEQGEPRYLDYLEQWGDGSDALIEHTIKNGIHKSVELSEGLSYPPNTEVLIEQILQWHNLSRNDISFMPSGRWLARFEEPKVGEWVFVNKNKVPVYKKATESSLIVGHLKVSDDILILKMAGDWCEVVRPANGYEEHKDHYSGYPEIVGYIRREFVEPIEKIIQLPLNEEVDE